MFNTGDLAPDFTFASDQGEDVTLSSFRGKKIVLYFYPKDNTSGCTKEACAFRDDYAQYTAQGAVVLGVSPDSIKSHEGFRLKHSLPFYLLSDPDHAVAAAYGAWGEKKNYGRVYEGIIRSTFVIDEEGKFIKVFPKVRVAGHSEQVLAALA